MSDDPKVMLGEVMGKLDMLIAETRAHRVETADDLHAIRRRVSSLEKMKYYLVSVGALVGGVGAKLGWPWLSKVFPS